MSHPVFLGPQRAWKTQKRRELVELEAALEVFRHGCAYTPMYDSGLYGIDTVTKAIKLWRKACSTKAWGR